MTNTNLLKSYIVKNNLTQNKVASILGISKQSLSNKINNKNEFKSKEIFDLCNLLKIDKSYDVLIEIFLN